MALPIPRLHLFEINDQSWFAPGAPPPLLIIALLGPHPLTSHIRFPPSLRSYVQAVLTHLWNLRLPFIQPQSPTFLVSQTLQRTLGAHLQDYTYVDFCAGAGGPTPAIEAEVNGLLRRMKSKPTKLGGGLANGGTHHEEKETGVDFVLTDIHPHLTAWRCASARSPRLRYVAKSVDAADAPRDLLDWVVEGEATTGAGGGGAGGGSGSRRKKIFRLFNLAFHHFDDELAREILRNTLETSEGFAIFELQGRDVGNLVTVLLIAPLLWLGSWYWFWGQWGHLFWTYVVPVVPIVTVYDGLVSCLRTRRDHEVLKLVNEAAKAGGGLNGWKFEAGGETHTWPIGSMQYLIGVKD